MMRHSLILAALLLASVETTDVNAQEAPADMMGQGQSHGGGSMMGCGMGGTMGHGMGMRRPGMMMVMMDVDGDGALSLEEVQSVHARMFKAMDADKNGKVTLEEIQQFFRPQ